FKCMANGRNCLEICYFCGRAGIRTLVQVLSRKSLSRRLQSASLASPNRASVVKQRRERDSNPRQILPELAFQTSALSHSAISLGRDLVLFSGHWTASYYRLKRGQR